MPRAARSAACHAPLSDASWRRQLARRLLRWYRQHQRDLPWRRTSDAYAVWISEIMLQQTQVATVAPYFERFLAAFPTVRSLAAADEREVLRLWEGLGYYRRARQMHRAARMVVERHGGRFPDDLESVHALPGIGRYTAGAVVSIAFDRRAPILEANTVRLLSRLFGLRGDPASAAGQRTLWRVAEEILPTRHCGQFNQALMELGSQVCTPRAPGCTRCPVQELCAARAQDAVDEIPRVRARPNVERVREAAVVLWHGRQVLVRQCARDERWAGLWDFPRFALDQEASSQALLERLRTHTGFCAAGLEPLATIKHSVTRFRITLECYQARCAPGARSAAGTWRWVRPAGLSDYPLSVTGRKLARMLVSGA